MPLIVDFIFASTPSWLQCVQVDVSIAPSLSDKYKDTSLATYLGENRYHGFFLATYTSEYMYRNLALLIPLLSLDIFPVLKLALLI
jgi:hypothetical protein